MDGFNAGQGYYGYPSFHRPGNRYPHHHSQIHSSQHAAMPGNGQLSTQALHPAFPVGQPQVIERADLPRSSMMAVQGRPLRSLPMHMPPHAGYEGPATTSANQSAAATTRRTRRLHAENEQLSSGNTQLLGQIEELRKENGDLQAENEELQAENDGLRRKVAKHDRLLEHAYNAARGKIRSAFQRAFYATVDVLTTNAKRIRAKQDRNTIVNFLRHRRTHQMHVATWDAVFPDAGSRESSESDDDEQLSSEVDSDDEESESEDGWESSGDSEDFRDDTNAHTALASGGVVHVGRRYMHGGDEDQEATSGQPQASTSGHRRRHGRRPRRP